MKKRIAIILSAMLVLAVTATMFALGTGAAAQDLWYKDGVFYTNADCTATATGVTTMAAAVTAAGDGGTITMLSGYTFAADESIETNGDVTIKNAMGFKGTNASDYFEATGEAGAYALGAKAGTPLFTVNAGITVDFGRDDMSGTITVDGGAKYTTGNIKDAENTVFSSKLGGVGTATCDATTGALSDFVTDGYLTSTSGLLANAPMFLAGADSILNFNYATLQNWASMNTSASALIDTAAGGVDVYMFEGAIKNICGSSALIGGSTSDIETDITFYATEITSNYSSSSIVRVVGTTSSIRMENAEITYNASNTTMFWASSGGKQTLTGITFNYNKSFGGTGLFRSQGTTGSITVTGDTEMCYNYMKTFGGLIRTDGTQAEGGGTYITGGNFSYNTFDGPASGDNWNYAGTLGCINGHYELDGLKVNHNTSTGRGAAVCLNANLAGVTIKNCEFNYNTSKGDGGAVYINNGAPNFSDCEFIGNTAADGRSGGAVYIREMNSDENPIKFTDCLFEDNLATVSSGSTGGGAIFSNTGKNNMVFDGCEFINNETKSRGGAIYFNTGAQDFIDCLFENNVAKGQGGAIYHQNNGAMEHTRSTFIGNRGSNGAAYYLNGTKTETIERFNDCKFINNYGSGTGATIANRGHKLVFTGTTYIVGNEGYAATGLYFFNTAPTSNLTLDGKMYIYGNVNNKGEFEGLSFDKASSGSVTLTENFAGSIVQLDPDKTANFSATAAQDFSDCFYAPGKIVSAAKNGETYTITAATDATYNVSFTNIAGEKVMQKGVAAGATVTLPDITFGLGSVECTKWYNAGVESADTITVNANTDLSLYPTNNIYVSGGKYYVDSERTKLLFDATFALDIDETIKYSKIDKAESVARFIPVESAALGALDATQVAWYDGTSFVEVDATLTAGKTYEPVFFVLVTEEGAHVKYETPAGLKFDLTAYITHAEAFIAAADVNFNMLIAPVDRLGEAEFTLAGLAEAGKVLNTDYAICDAESLAINGNVVTYNAYLTSIRTYNYARDFASRAIATYDLGTEKAVDGSYDASKNVRNVVEIAIAALKDTKAEAVDEYVNTIVVGETTYYTPYSAEQIALLKKYVDNVISITYTPAAGETPASVAVVDQVNVEYYTVPYKAAIVDGKIVISRADGNTTWESYQNVAGINYRSTVIINGTVIVKGSESFTLPVGVDAGYISGTALEIAIVPPAAS